MDRSYKYRISVVEQEKPAAQIFVPNCEAYTAIQIMLWLAGKRDNFPEYKDGSNVVIGMDDSAWASPREYMEAYCPRSMVCIVREKKKTQCRRSA